MLPLREGWSAAEEAQNAYRRIRKLRRSVEAVKPLLEQVQLKEAYVEELQVSVWIWV
jgi:predicted ribosome quality control (RQC) complex YloA/Tae2 family protein